MPRIIGTSSEVADVMGRYAEIGTDEFVVSDHSLGGDASQKRDNMDRFVDEVVIHLQNRFGS
jgi:alkanesulfonate monooxygenase SsuD/methylene tetrahydromethanopterin reductase-like flavin-dependent oxidoreductase (luciferase family)